MTVIWYQARLQGQDMHAFTRAQIKQYEGRWQSDSTINSKSSGVHDEHQSKRSKYEPRSSS
jgi:hypothetical protein